MKIMIAAVIALITVIGTGQLASASTTTLDKNFRACYQTATPPAEQSAFTQAFGPITNAKIIDQKHHTTFYQGLEKLAINNMTFDIPPTPGMPPDMQNSTDQGIMAISHCMMLLK
jgi:hypothetical protein